MSKTTPPQHSLHRLAAESALEALELIGEGYEMVCQSFAHVVLPNGARYEAQITLTSERSDFVEHEDEQTTPTIKL